MFILYVHKYYQYTENYTPLSHSDSHGELIEDLKSVLFLLIVEGYTIWIYSNHSNRA